jgi:hypothetical protein
MTPLELALTSLSEATAITLHRSRDSQGFPELKRDATDVGKTTGKARKVIEEDIGQSAISSENYLHLNKVKGPEQQRESVLPEVDKSIAPALDQQHSLFDEEL